MRHNSTLLLLVICFSLWLVGCDAVPADDRDLVEAFFEEWLEVKEIDPVNDDGSLNLEGVAKAGRRIVTDSTGDDEADAALDAYDVISNINEADKLMDDGLLFRDPAMMDQAIALRPGDWTYRSARAAYALSEGNMDDYQVHTTQSFRISEKRKVDPLWYANTNIKEYEAAEKRLFIYGWKDSGQCITLYQELAIAYQTRLGFTKSPEDRAALDRSYNNMDLCRQRSIYPSG